MAKKKRRGGEYFADVIKNLARLSKWALNYMTGVPIQERRRRLHTQRDFHVTTESETGDVATNHGIKAATRSWKRKEQNPPQSLEGEYGLENTLILAQ